MNPINGSPLLLAPAGTLPATDSLTSNNSWSGLAVEANRVGVNLDPATVTRFARYRDFLLARNTRVNLTAIRHPVEVERRLFLDALAMLPAIDAFLETTSQVRRPRLIDIGSGGGFPGLVLKIARPVIDVTLVDATAKKVAFLEEVIAALELDAVHAVHGRAEELGHNPRYREQFEIATARAVASLPVLLEFVLPFLDVGGQAFLPKGLAIADELNAGRRAARRLGAEIVSAQRSPYGDTRLVINRDRASDNGNGGTETVSADPVFSDTGELVEPAPADEGVEPAVSENTGESAEPVTGGNYGPGGSGYSEDQIIEIIYEAADNYGQSREDMLRVARCESGLNPHAVGGGGAYHGLYQFVPSTFAQTPYGEYDIYDPWANANAASWSWSEGGKGTWVCQ